MWTPTHVQVTVHRGRNLLSKGKHGTNDAYVTIQLGKEKFQTTVKDKSENPEWHEECDMLLGDMDQCVILNVYHRNLLGLDNFLGHLALPLTQFQIYERPKSRWFALKNKSSSLKKEKYRGELEVTVAFTVKNIPEREKLHAKLEKRKSRDSDDLNKDLPRAGSFANLLGGARFDRRRHSLNVEALTASGLLPATPGKPRTSPVKSDKFDRRRHSLHPEVLGTIPSFEIATRSESPSQHSTSLSSSCSSLTHSETSLQRQGLGRSSNTSATRSTDSPQLQRVILEEEADDLNQNTQADKEDDPHFSRRNSFRQAIGRGSGRRASLRRGSSHDFQPGTPPESPLSGYLLGGEAEISQDDTTNNPTPLRSTAPQTPSPLTNTSPTTSNTSLKSRPKSPPVKPPRRNASDESLTASNNNIAKQEASSTQKLSESQSEERPDDVFRAATTTHVSQEQERCQTLNTRRPIPAYVIADTLAENEAISSDEPIVPNEILDQFKQFSREKLVEMVLTARQEGARMRKEKRDLEDYLDSLLVRVMETQPLLLQNPASPPSRRHYSHGELIESHLGSGPQQLNVEQLNQHNTAPSYPPPAYTQPNNNPYTQSRAKSPPKQVKQGVQKREKKGGLFKRFSAAFK